MIKIIKGFLNYTEIKTKITSVLTFFLVLAFLVYEEEDIRWKETWIFFAGMLLFDLATTAVNNYIDSKSNGQALDFGRRTSLIIIYVMVGISTLLGLYLVYLTDVVILLAGGICFVCGILYTYGPLPISRLPLGEIFSGFFYGGMIPFIIMYINMPPASLVGVAYGEGVCTITLGLVPILKLAFLAVIPFCVTAGIMLANNICDLDKDIEVNRYTLPFYIKGWSLTLFGILYIVPYLSLVGMVWMGMLPPTVLLACLTLWPVWKNVRRFRARQDKSTTFSLAIVNFILIMCSVTLLTGVGTILGLFSR